MPCCGPTDNSVIVPCLFDNADLYEIFSVDFTWNDPSLLYSTADLSKTIPKQ